MRIELIKACENAKNLGDKKEIICSRQLVVLDRENDSINTLSVARWYMSKSHGASTVYCSVWFYSDALGEHCSGYGSAGGGGYCKSSSAFADAVSSAGVSVDIDISGRDMSLVDDFFRFLAIKAGYEVFTVCGG